VGFTKHERPTVPPSFDVHKFAKDSDERIAGAARVPPDDEEGAGERSEPRSETRLVTRPTMGAVNDEAWARSMLGVPVVVLAPNQIVRLPLDHRAGFVLSLMDGLLDLDTLIELSTMQRAPVLRLVRDLYESGVIEFRV